MATVLDFAAIRAKRGLPASTAPLPTLFAMGDLVRHAQTQRRGIVVDTGTYEGRQFCVVLFYEGKGSDDTMTSCASASLTLLQSSAERAQRLDDPTCA